MIPVLDRGGGSDGCGCGGRLAYFARFLLGLHGWRGRESGIAAQDFVVQQSKDTKARGGDVRMQAIDLGVRRSGRKGCMRREYGCLRFLFCFNNSIDTQMQCYRELEFGSRLFP